MQEGEAQRRKLHNLIQELRGNVRVFARVRPFLPSDRIGEGAPPCIDVNGHDDSLVIRKRGPGPDAAVLESHAFSFDKCFAPCAGQEAVFQEVRATTRRVKCRRVTRVLSCRENGVAGCSLDMIGTTEPVTFGWCLPGLGAGTVGSGRV